MNIVKKILEEDGKAVAGNTAVDWNCLQGCTVLITGATGLIGVNLIRGIMEYNESHEKGIEILALVRSQNKGRKLFAQYIEKGWLQLVTGDILEPLQLEMPVDFIIHGASVTAGRDFVEKPVETIITAMEGTKNLLEFARQKKVKSMVYLSSMEVYGTPADNLTFD